MIKPFSVPDGDEDILSDITIREFDAKDKAHYALLQVLNDDDITRVIHCKFAMRFGYIWLLLIKGHHKSIELR